MGHKREGGASDEATRNHADHMDDPVTDVVGMGSTLEQAIAHPRLRKLGRALGTSAFLVPAAGVCVIVALAMNSYVPLTFDPQTADASEAAAAPTLQTVDAAELEGDSGPVEGAGETSDLGIDTSHLKDGTYTGTGTGYAGPITVEVTISGGRITSIRIVSTVDGDNYITRASAVISSVIDKQSPDVDTISGATYSSKGILQAIRNALAKAQGGAQESLSVPAGAAAQASSAGSVDISTPAVDTSNLKDGIYTGTGMGFEDGRTVVRVTVQGGRIVSVENVSNEDQPEGRDYFADAFASIVPQVISRQTTSGIDAVTGATYSSRGILQGIADALRQAAGSGGGAVTPKPAVSKDALAAQVAEAAALKKADYTSASWQALRSALEAAVAVNADDDTTQSQVDAASESLRAALDALEAAPARPDSPGDDGPHYADGTFVGYALCDAGEDADFYPYYVAVAVTVRDGEPQPLKADDVKGTDRAHDSDAVLDPYDTANQRYLDYALNGRTRRGITYAGVLGQLAPAVGMGDVDVVSGATYSSHSVVAAYQDALSQARAAYDSAHGGARAGDMAADESAAETDVGNDSAAAGADASVASDGEKAAASGMVAELEGE